MYEDEHSRGFDGHSREDGHSDPAGPRTETGRVRQKFDAGGEPGLEQD
jgi:hypothetical protein